MIPHMTLLIGLNLSVSPRNETFASLFPEVNSFPMSKGIQFVHFGRGSQHGSVYQRLWVLCMQANLSKVNVGPGFKVRVYKLFFYQVSICMFR